MRVLKNAENHLSAADTINQSPSYLMECLAWNVPDRVLWSGAPANHFQETLGWLWLHLGHEYDREDWVMPNELKYCSARIRRGRSPTRRGSSSPHGP